jgi:hypothetical protein
MADVSITAANVARVTTGSNPTKVLQVTWGATITAGLTVYKDTADEKWKAADNNVSALLAGSAGIGIALSGGANGQLGLVAIGGDLTAGGTLTLGETYIVSSTAGGIAPVADISTNFVTVLGVAITTAILRMSPNGPIVSGIQRA